MTIIVLYQTIIKLLKYTSIYFVLLFISVLSCKNDIKPSQKLTIQENKQIVIDADSNDIRIYNNIIDYSIKNKLSNKTLPEIEISIAKYLIGTPYVAHTLEKEGEEKLVINLREMDCTTFVENVIAISTCIYNKTIGFSDLSKVLTKIRYKNGVINKYPSRLHYFTEWLTDNERMNLISIISNSFAKDNFDSKVNFMSTHPVYYKQLKNKRFLEKIVYIEKKISKAKLKYIPKEKIHLFENKIQNGDIIAITTSINGLDIAHVGLAIIIEGRLHLFHESFSQKQVVISKEPLEDYLENFKKKNGIIVARLNTK